MLDDVTFTAMGGEILGILRLGILGRGAGARRPRGRRRLAGARGGFRRRPCGLRRDPRRAACVGVRGQQRRLGSPDETGTQVPGPARVSTAAEARAPLFDALGDPNRLRIVVRLCEAGPCSTSQVTQVIPVTRQAATKHLLLLEAVGLVTSSRHGRERIWRIQPDPLAEASEYLTALSKRWDRALDRLRSELESAFSARICGGVSAQGRRGLEVRRGYQEARTACLAARSGGRPDWLAPAAENVARSARHARRMAADVRRRRASADVAGTCGRRHRPAARPRTSGDPSRLVDPLGTWHARVLPRAWT